MGDTAFGRASGGLYKSNGVGPERKNKQWTAGIGEVKQAVGEGAFFSRIGRGN